MALKLWYEKEAPHINDDFYDWDWNHPRPDDDGWEKWSLPLGNGYMGVNVFGRTKTERFQITENSLSNPVKNGAGGLGAFGEIYVDFGHENVSEYSRELDIERAVASVKYDCGGVKYSRTHFTSYPDRVFVSRFEASKAGALSFSAYLNIPGVRPYLFEEGDGMGKTGSVEYKNDTAALSGEPEYYKIKYEGILKVLSDGTISSGTGGITVRGATWATLIFAAGTNYRLESRVFTESDPKKKLAPYTSPHTMLENILSVAQKYTYDELLSRHVSDYTSLFSRVGLSLAERDDTRPTDEILRDYKSGKTSRYLEQLYFQYGRYLLISSSRKNSYPANLQGTWNRYNTSPWSCGYWHNINVQMNYWPAMSTNISETFEPYMDYCEAYQALAQKNADDYISRYYPENFSEKTGENGWTIGTGAWLYNISAAPDAKTGHSGPGTGGFTVKLLYEYYAFTKDEKVLRRVYPLIESMAKFLLKTLVYESGEWLVKYSASPEQCENGHYVPTRGCAFDQQMVWETLHDLITLSELLGVENDTVKEAKEKIDKLSPVIIGASGQVKEFREEQNYGDIGEYNHRHISQLVGLYPGTSISPDNKAHINAARFTLTARGDKSTGWSTAHKMNLWARAQNGDRAFALYKMLLSNCTAWNLWDMHPPFQIDGNFGGTAGVSEMLAQSHAGYIHLLPAIPVEWQSGSFSGLVARGNFVLSAKWENAKVVSLDVVSRSGGKCRVRDYGIKEILCDGEQIGVSTYSGIAEFDTVKGKKYTVISKQR